MPAKLTYVPVFACEFCGKFSARTFMKSWRCYSYAQRFCSHACANKARPRVGSVDKHGYRVHNINGHQYAEHRLIMEYVLGRDLHPDETVHHKNGNRRDNRPENLELWCGRHGRGQRVEDQVAFAVEILSVYPEFLTEEQREKLVDLIGGPEIPQVTEEIVGHASSETLVDGEMKTSPLLGV